MEPTLDIMSTIQSAIERASDAWVEVEETELCDQSGRTRWVAYHNELQEMGRGWADVYPLAEELAKLGLHTLQGVHAELLDALLT